MDINIITEIMQKLGVNHDNLNVLVLKKPRFISTQNVNYLPSLKSMAYMNVFNLLPEGRSLILDKPDIIKFVSEISHTLFLARYDAVASLDIDKTISIYEDIDNIEPNVQRIILEKILKYSIKILELFNQQRLTHESSNIEFIKFLLANIAIKQNISVESLRDDIREIIDTLSCSFSNSIDDLLLRNTIYKNSITKMMKYDQEREHSLIEKGIWIGHRLVNALNNAGYEYCNHSKQWVKHVSIIPEFFIKGGKYYSIPSEKRIWGIGKLIVSIYNDSTRLNVQSEVYDGKFLHPNVNFEQICMGQEIRTRFERLINGAEAAIEDFTNIYLDIEKALEVINFDSSYRQIDYYRLDYRDFLVSDIIPKYENIDKIKHIRRI